MKKLNKRKWLNPKISEDAGAIHYSASYDEYWMGCDFSIWDCSRKISLNFDVQDEKSFKQRLKKIDIMVESLIELREYIEENFEEFMDMKKAAEAKHKAERANRLGQTNS